MTQRPKRLASVVFWSVIAAAFIGPGTVTTAASSGARYGYVLLWALVFSAVATLVLQEAAARLTIVSGRTLGEAIREQFSAGARGVLVLLLVLGAIVLGNAAYEAGNILGAVAGASLGTSLPPALMPVVIGAAAGAVLWLGTLRTVAHVLSITVALMGVAFLVTAVLLGPPMAGVVRGSLMPSLPPGSGLLVLGLIGTTVVPYNLFLGSGMAAGQNLGDLRFGLSIAVVLGGLISMGVLVVGAAVDGPFSFEALAGTLSARLGDWAGPLFAWGLFAAGFSSATTAPLAAAVTARSLFDTGDGRWDVHSWRYRGVWLGILSIGVAFGFLEVRPIPAIILAQALNGILLPFAAIFLLLAVNDRALVREGANSALSNVLMAIVVTVAVILGVSNVLRAAAATAGWREPADGLLLAIGLAVALALAFPVARGVLRRRGVSAGGWP
jgi:manganese transport protein